MREIRSLVRAGIRRAHREFTGIVILSLLLGMILSLTLTINRNTELRHTQAFREVGLATITAGFSERYLEAAGLTVDALAEQLAQAEYVESVQYGRAMSVYIDYEGQESTNRVLLVSAEHTKLNYRVENEAGRQPLFDAEIAEGEIYVPYSYQSLCSAEIGGTVTLRGTDEKFRVAGFFEDPLMGGSMMGIKTLIIGDRDMERLRKTAWQEGDVMPQRYGMLIVQKSADCPWSDALFERRLNEETGFENYAGTTLTETQSRNYMLLMTKIFAGIMVVFAVILSLVILVVIGHSIAGSLEMEYVNLGILKALGFTGAKLTASLLLQYVIAASAGVAVGIPLAIPLVGLVNHMTLPMTCLAASDNLSWAQCLSAGAGILLFITCYTALKLRKIQHITPLRAISEGREDVYFASRLQTGIYKKGLNLWLALRQLVSGGKQYLGAGVIAVLLVFFLSITTEINDWIGQDGESLQNLFCCNSRDFDIFYHDETLRPEVETFIRERAGISASYRSIQGYIMLNGSPTMSCVSDAPETYTTVYEGRTCRYDNEIIINQFLAEELGVGIGDFVELSQAGRKEDFLITGYFEWGNDTGNNFAMNTAGYKRLTGELPGQMWYNYEVENKDAAAALVEEIGEKYGTTEVEISGRNIFDGINIIVDVVHGIVWLIYVIAAVFVIVAVSLVCGKMFRREQRNYGIMKAVGFTDRALRRQFALRFLCVSVAGCVGGGLLNLLLAEKCAGILLGMIGCTGIGERYFTVFSVLFPCVFLCVMFYLVSFVNAAKAERTDITVLLM